MLQFHRSVCTTVALIIQFASKALNCTDTLDTYPNRRSIDGTFQERNDYVYFAHRRVRVGAQSDKNDITSSNTTSLVVVYRLRYWYVPINVLLEYIMCYRQTYRKSWYCVE